MSKQAQRQTLKVLVLGFPRTGTTSMQRVLKNLGYNCYNDYAILRHMRHQIPFWDQIGSINDQNTSSNTSKINWDSTFIHDKTQYTAAMGLPVCLYWKDIISYYPDCKVILLKRDCNKWYKSVFQTFGWHYPFIRPFMNLMPSLFLYKKYYNLTHIHNIGFNSYSFVKNKKNAMNRYNDYNNQILEYFEKNNLMKQLFIVDFDIKDNQQKQQQFYGLLNFLECDSKSTDDRGSETFPHANKRYLYLMGYGVAFLFIFWKMSYTTVYE